MQLSVIICTHNPRTDYLGRTIQALKAQTLAKDQWELLLVDNRSSPPLSEQVDLSWHPHGRHVREETLGLTPARLCGIERAQGEILVFVDDDNVLDGDYIAACADIGRRFPFLGVWGGQILPEFEAQPQRYAKPYIAYLACRTVEKVFWANIPFSEATPSGAGMCVRKCVADTYLSATRANSIAASLDRKGDDLTGAGDFDIAFTACDLGFGMGAFPQLKLAHLIPKRRLEREYLLRLIEGCEYSLVLLRHQRGLNIRRQRRTVVGGIRSILRWGVRAASGDLFEHQADEARKRGFARAQAEIARDRGPGGQSFPRLPGSAKN